jgi:hypothetical protein
MAAIQSAEDKTESPPCFDILERLLRDLKLEMLSHIDPRDFKHFVRVYPRLESVLGSHFRVLFKGRILGWILNALTLDIYTTKTSRSLAAEKSRQVIAGGRHQYYSGIDQYYSGFFKQRLQNVLTQIRHINGGNAPLACPLVRWIITFSEVKFLEWANDVFYKANVVSVRDNIFEIGDFDTLSKIKKSVQDCFLTDKVIGHAVFIPQATAGAAIFDKHRLSWGIHPIVHIEKSEICYLEDHNKAVFAYTPL